MDLGLSEATAVVVGGSRGMGLATACCLADDGAKVAVLARSEPDLDAAVERVRHRGSPDAVGIAVNMVDEDRVRETFDLLAARWGGRLNILINAAGPYVQGTFDELSDAQWQEAFDTGVRGLIHTIRAALPQLRAAEWARIVNFSAHSTKRQTASLVAYTAAKATVTSLSKNLSLHLAKDGILVNVLSPGSVSSAGLLDWAAGIGLEDPDPARLMEAISDHFGHPAHLPRVGSPDEIGPVAAFLASRRNSYMTGADVNVDGGSDFT